MMWTIHIIYQKAFIYIWFILAQRSWRRFLNDPNQFLHICNHLPFEQDLALNLNNLELFTQEWCTPIWLKLACWFWRRFKKKNQYNFAFLLLSTFGLGRPLRLNNLESCPPKDDLCQVWSKLALWFWRISRNCKSLQTDRRTTGDQKSSRELKRRNRDRFGDRFNQIGDGCQNKEGSTKKDLRKEG
jgi:hypothetical protein